MIRFLIDTTVRRRDVNGNCYNFSIITSTKTGESLKVDSGWGSDGGNIKHFLRQAGLEWEEIHYTERTVPAREYKRLESLRPESLLEHELSNEAILALERKR